MDIDLLSKMVKELILVNDRVTLPGVGAFVAEMVPASFTDRGYTINPPYRRLVFRQGVSREKDHLLADMYASANNIDREMAEKLLREFLKGMVEELRKRKMLVFTGLGRLRATRENNFFFICDENLDIFPEGMGLEAVSLKSHSKLLAFIANYLAFSFGAVTATVFELVVARPSLYLILTKYSAVSPAESRLSWKVILSAPTDIMNFARRSLGPLR